MDCVIGKNVKYYRELSGFTQKDLADQLGITYQQIQKYENGRDRISAVRLWDIANIFGKKVIDFYKDR